MKHFIANRICFPLAIAGFTLAASASIIGTIAATSNMFNHLLHKPTQNEQFLDEVVNYCSDIGWVGVSEFIGAAVIAEALGGFEPKTEVISSSQPSREPAFDTWAEIEKYRARILKEKCSGCQFYCRDNSYLHCAVHPDLKYNCLDFDPID